METAITFGTTPNNVFSLQISNANQAWSGSYTRNQSLFGSCITPTLDSIGTEDPFHKVISVQVFFIGGVLVRVIIGDDIHCFQVFLKWGLNVPTGLFKGPGHRARICLFRPSRCQHCSCCCLALLTLVSESADYWEIGFLEPYVHAGEFYYWFDPFWSNGRVFENRVEWGIFWRILGQNLTEDLTRQSRNLILPVI